MKYEINPYSCYIIIHKRHGALTPCIPLKGLGQRLRESSSICHPQNPYKQLDIYIYMGVEPKIGVITLKWMVKIMENPIKIDDLGGKPTIFGNTHMVAYPCMSFADLSQLKWITAKTPSHMSCLVNVSCGLKVSMHFGTTLGYAL